jgi:hypothetical protein
MKHFVAGKNKMHSYSVLGKLLKKEVQEPMHSQAIKIKNESQQDWKGTPVLWKQALA